MVHHDHTAGIAAAPRAGYISVVGNPSGLVHVIQSRLADPRCRPAVHHELAFLADDRNFTTTVHHQRALEARVFEARGDQAAFVKPAGQACAETIKQQHPSKNDGDENSCWTTYLDKSSGSPDVKALFQVSSTCSGAALDGAIDIGTPIYQNKGQQNADYGVASQFFMTDYPNRCWLIPVIDGSGNCDAKNPAPIKDWAKICPTAVSKNGSHSYIQANVTCNQNIHDSHDTSLCFSHRLVREPSKGY